MAAYQSDVRETNSLYELVKTGLLERLLGGRPPGGIPLQEQVNKLHRFGTGVNEHLIQRRVIELGELEVHFRRQLIAFRPLTLEMVPTIKSKRETLAGKRGKRSHLGRRAEQRANLEQLIDFTAAREQRSEIVQLGYDTTDCPHVNGTIVISRVEQHLWCAIPFHDFPAIRA